MRLLSILLNEYCLILVLFGWRLPQGMATGPVFRWYNEFLPVEWWVAIYIGSGVAGYTCLYLSRYHGYSTLWREWLLILGAPLFLCNTTLFLKSGVSVTGVTTYGVLFLTCLAKALGLYEGDAYHPGRRR